MREKETKFKNLIKGIQKVMKDCEKLSRRAFNSDDAADLQVHK